MSAVRAGTGKRACLIAAGVLPIVLVAAAVPVDSKQMSMREGWRTVAVGTALTFQVPPATRERSTQQIDSLVGVFDGDGYEITYDYGSFSERVEIYHDRPDYEVSERRVSSRKGLAASFRDAENDPTLPFARLLRIDDGPRALTLRVSCRTADACGVADAIFSSVKFNK